MDMKPTHHCVCCHQSFTHFSAGQHFCYADQVSASADCPYCAGVLREISECSYWEDSSVDPPAFTAQVLAAAALVRSARAQARGLPESSLLSVPFELLDCSCPPLRQYHMITASLLVSTADVACLHLLQQLDTDILLLRGIKHDAKMGRMSRQDSISRLRATHSRIQQCKERLLKKAPHSSAQAFCSAINWTAELSADDSPRPEGSLCERLLVCGSDGRPEALQQGGVSRSLSS